MKKKYLNFLMFFVLFNVFLYSQEENQTPNQKENQEYKVSKEKYKNLINQSIEKDFKEKLKIAQELEDINPDMSYQRYLEIIFVYPEYFQKPEFAEKILDSLFNYYFNYKNMEDFFLLVEELKKRNIVDTKLEEKIKQKYISKF